MSAEPLSEVELEDYRADVTGRVNVDQRWGRGDIRSLLATISALQSRLERAESEVKALREALGMDGDDDEDALDEQDKPV